MAGLRVHFEARNPLVIATNYDGYFDPETYGNIYAQPMARTLLGRTEHYLLIR